MRAATTVAGVALLLAGGALATLVPISDKQLDKRAARGGGRAAIERESERVEAAARRFTHAALRREGGVVCARMLAPEAIAGLEASTRTPCERYYRERARAGGRLLIDRTSLYGRVALIDAHTGRDAFRARLPARQGRAVAVRPPA